MIISFRDSINFSSSPVSFRKHGCFRRITMEQRFSGEKERLLVAMREKKGREGGCSKENWRESSVSRVLPSRQKGFVKKFIDSRLFPRNSSRTIVRSTPSSHVHKRERTKGWRKMEEEHRNGWPDSFSTGTFLLLLLHGREERGREEGNWTRKYEKLDRLASW